MKVKTGREKIAEARRSARCQAMSKQTGLQCKQAAIRGGKVCVLHGGATPIAKAMAQLRLATLVDPALEVMFDLLIDKKTPPAVRYSIIKDILDRTGYKPVERSEVKIWNGDPSTLSDEQLGNLVGHLERIAFGEDKARLIEEKRRVMIEAGAAPSIIDAEFAEAEMPKEPEPEVPKEPEEEKW